LHLRSISYCEEVNGAILFFANHDASVWDNQIVDPAYWFRGTNYPENCLLSEGVDHYTQLRDVILSQLCFYCYSCFDLVKVFS